MRGHPLRKVLSHKWVVSGDNQIRGRREFVERVEPVEHVLQVYDDGEGFACLKILIVVCCI